MHVVKSIRNDQNVLIIQPYIKWGPKKSPTPPDLKLQEAEALIRSLDKWSIEETVKVGLLNFDKKTFFGKGQLEELIKLKKKIDETKNQVSSVGRYM